MTPENAPVSRGTLGETPILDAAAIDRIVAATGLELAQDKRASLLRMLNLAVYETLSISLSDRFYAAKHDFQKMKQALQTYRDLAQKHQNSDMFPIEPNEEDDVLYLKPGYEETSWVIWRYLFDQGRTFSHAMFLKTCELYDEKFKSDEKIVVLRKFERAGEI